MTNATADELSLCCSKIVVSSQRGALATASGFAIMHEGDVFLLTNWHVVSGLSASTGELLEESGHPPHRLDFKLHNRGQGLPNLGFNLYDNGNQPVWLEHPKLGSKFDVVAFRITDPATKDAVFALEPLRSKNDMAVWPGMTAAVVGFPLGYSGPATLPIWKTGHIANDLSLDCREGPCFYLDATTRTGMSGAPVFLSQIGAYQMENGDVNMVPGRNFRWLGVYSGRIDKDAEVGVVWKAHAVMELIRAGVRPK